MTELKYNFEYFCSPIWIKNIDKGDIGFSTISVDNTPISEELKKEINDLDLIYQSTYNDEYPPEPKLFLLDEELIFLERVVLSSQALKESLPSDYKLSVDVSVWLKRIEELNSKKFSA